MPESGEGRKTSVVPNAGLSRTRAVMLRKRRLPSAGGMSAPGGGTRSTRVSAKRIVYGIEQRYAAGGRWRRRCWRSGAAMGSQVAAGGSSGKALASVRR